MNRPKQLVLGGVALAGTVALSIGGAYVTPPAQAATGTPYTVDASGITLTDGTTFLDNGHVNIEVEGVGQINFQFESKCIAPQADSSDRPECFQDAITRHDMAQFIGQENIPWSAFGLTTDFCITWVQISHENLHFGADFGSKFCITGSGGCVVDTIHHDAQYKYSRTVPEQNHVENKYKQTGKVYTVEHKVTGLTNNATTNTSIVSWYGTIGAVYSATYDKWQLPDDVVNAAGVNPFNVAKTGSVDLYFYGYPGHATVPYEITAIEVYSTQPAGSLFYTVDNITLYYTGSGNTPSTSSGDAVYTATNPGSPWVTFGTPKTVVDVPSKVVYYITGGGESNTNTDANWTTDTPGAPWVKIADVKKDAYDEYVYGPCPPPTNEECTTYNHLTVTSLAQLDLSRTRSQGDSKLVDGADHVTTWNDADNNQPGGNDQRKAAGYLDVPDFPLSQTGTLAIDYTGTGTGPGGQILLDLDGDSSNNTLTLAGQSGDSIGVFEPAFYGQNMWLADIQPGLDVSGANVPHVGGGGGAINGSINDYLKEWPNARGLALGYSQGSGVVGDNMLTLIQGGCVQVTFGIPANTDEETKFDESDGTWVCGDNEVPVTTTYYKRVKVWDVDSQSYVWGAWQVTSVVDSTRVLTADEIKEKCAVVPIPADATKHEECGVANDSYTKPTATPDMAVDVKDYRDAKGVGDVVITATTLNGLQFTDGTTVRTWTLPFTNGTCGLAFTGVDPLALFLSAVVLLVLGILGIRAHRRRKGAHAL